LALVRHPYIFISLFIVISKRNTKSLYFWLFSYTELAYYLVFELDGVIAGDSCTKIHCKFLGGGTAIFLFFT